MAAGIEVHAQYRLAGVGHGMKHRVVRLASGMRLHVGETAAEELAGALDRQLLDDVDIGGAAVIAASDITLDRLLVSTEPCTSMTAADDIPEAIS
jgi:hypothetical protein